MDWTETFLRFDLGVGARLEQCLHHLHVPVLACHAKRRHMRCCILIIWVDTLVEQFDDLLRVAALSGGAEAVTASGTQTLTNKTLTSPSISGNVTM